MPCLGMSKQGRRTLLNYEVKELLNLASVSLLATKPEMRPKDIIWLIFLARREACPKRLTR